MFTSDTLVEIKIRTHQGIKCLDAWSPAFNPWLPKLCNLVKLWPNCENNLTPPVKILKIHFMGKKEFKHMKHKCRKKKGYSATLLLKNASKNKIVIPFIKLAMIFFKLLRPRWRKVSITFLESNLFGNIYRDANKERLALPNVVGGNRNLCWVSGGQFGNIATRALRPRASTSRNSS